MSKFTGLVMTLCGYGGGSAWVLLRALCCYWSHFSLAHALGVLFDLFSATNVVHVTVLSLYTALYEWRSEMLDHLDDLVIGEQSLVGVRNDDQLVARGALFALSRIVLQVVKGHLSLVRLLQHISDAAQTKSCAAARHDLGCPLLQVKLQSATLALQH